MVEVRSLTALGEKLLYSLGDTATDTPVSFARWQQGG